MELTESLKSVLIEGANALKGSARRLFMARTGNGLPSANWVGTVKPSAKELTNSRRAFPSRTLSIGADANPPKTDCRLCSPTSKRWWTDKARPIHRFATTSFIPA